MIANRPSKRKSLPLLAAMLSGVLATPAMAHNIYLVNDNHTDYGWNATTDAYEASMLSELDYYRGRIDATAGSPSSEQARFNADCWYYLYLYEKNRTAAQFQDLIDKMIDGHITVPLNPF
ncbi:MAG TPA: glycoside hydrolase, partial [Candidatus Kryptonia bacterium]|nr:glycoside hydrolase [Candidatus Kryptonia bacterium]